MNLQYLELLIAVASGGVLQWFVSLILSRRQDNRHDFSEIVKTWSLDNNRLREENENLRKLINDHEVRIRALQNQISLIESSHQDLPIPMWLKDLDGKMLALNREYERTFLKPKGLTIQDYIGKYDHEVWDKDTADEFKSHDAKVLELKRPMAFKNEGLDFKGRIIKFPIYAGGIIVGVAGIAIADNQWE